MSMAVRVFYSWQSDRRQNRNFIRSALEAVVKDLRQDLALEEAQRDITLDQDTQGLPGSPAIADAILTKIRSSDVFIGDVTFIDGDLDSHTSEDTRRTPNPNVMLEFGYALHALGDAKIIGVFNEASGSPQRLPFDLAHRRWPIRFNLPNGQSANRQNEKQRLTAALKDALRSIISQFEEPKPRMGAPAPFLAAEPGDGVGRLRHAQDFLCIGSAGESKPVWLRQGPYAFLRLIPSDTMPELGEVEAYKIAQAHLQPMGGMRSGSWRSGRHRTGSVNYWTAVDNPESAWDASELFLSRELWANDFYHIDPERDRAKHAGFPFIPTGAVEEVFIDTFINFVQVASEHLAIATPVRVIAGLAGVHGFRLAVDPNYFGFNNFAGRILRESVILESVLNQWSLEPFDFLLPFFKNMYDAAGETRPPIRTSGRRQR
jgi:hypothetical protein